MTTKNWTSPSTFKATHAIVAAIFPKTFAENDKPKRPLKIGIDHDLRATLKTMAPGVSGRMIRSFLHGYTADGNYLRSVKEGAERVGLDGESVDVVTKEQETHAAEKLHKRKKNSKRLRRKGAKPQQREEKQ